MLARSFIVALLFLLPVSSLFGQGQRVRRTLVHDNMRRNYITYTPSGYDPAHPLPLVLSFHGLTSSAVLQEGVSGMNEVAERKGFLLAYPDAVNGDWMTSDDHNIGFIESLLDAMAADYSVDSQRVYATGASHGAIMTFILAAALPDRFAAIAPLAGSRLVSNVANRQPTFLTNTPNRPLQLLYMHGTADTSVPCDGGNSSSNDSFLFSPIAEILAEWIDNNGGTSLAPATSIPGIEVTDGPAVSLFQCSDCESYIDAAGSQLPAEVIHMRINGGGHMWPEPDTLKVSEETGISFAGINLPRWFRSQRLWD